MPQVNFVELDGERIADRLYAIERLDSMLEAIGTRVGARLDASTRANQTLNFRVEALRSAVMWANKHARGMLPRGTYARLKALAAPVLTETPRRGGPEPFRSPFVDDFVMRFYAADLALHHQVRPESGSPALLP